MIDKHIFSITFFMIMAMAVPPSAAAKEFPKVTPDSYICMPDGCNSCSYKITHVLGAVISTRLDGCTELACAAANRTIEDDGARKNCAKDWRYSKSLTFNDLSHAENRCFNGVRNHNYAEAFDISDAGTTPESLEHSASYAHHLCNGYFDRLAEEFGLSENELNVFAQYIASRQLPYFNLYKPQTMVRGEKMYNIHILNTIFTLLEERQWVNRRMVVTAEMLQTFRTQYRLITKKE